MTHYIYTARRLAYHAAQFQEFVTVQQTFEVLQTVWDRSDIYNAWIASCYTLMQSPQAAQVSSADLAVLQVSFFRYLLGFQSSS